MLQLIFILLLVILILKCGEFHQKYSQEHQYEIEFPHIYELILKFYFNYYQILLMKCIYLYFINFLLLYLLLLAKFTQFISSSQNDQLLLRSFN